MRDNAALLKGLFPTGNTFEYGEALVKSLIRFHIHEISCRASMLGNQHRDSLAVYL
jgi:hypothetical protein